MVVVVNNIFLLVIFFIFGVVINYLNTMYLKKTIDNFLIKKNKFILLYSFFIRMLVFLIIFVSISIYDINMLYSVFFGIIISKILLLIKKHL